MKIKLRETEKEKNVLKFPLLTRSDAAEIISNEFIFHVFSIPHIINVIFCFHLQGNFPFKFNLSAMQFSQMELLRDCKVFREFFGNSRKIFEV